MGRLEGKVAIVTGSDEGIGREIAFHLAREGAAVTVTYATKADKAQVVVQDIEKSGSRAIAVQADVSKPDAVARLFRETMAHFGRLDILVNNAGVEREANFWEMPLDVYQWIIDVSLTGPWLCSQHAARQMIDQGDGGRIINISSVHEDMPMPTNAAYCTAKGGLRMLMRTIAVELAPYKITVNNIAPGAIDTPLDKPTKDDPKKYQQLLAEIPLHRMGQPEEVAELAIYLASPAAAYVTGSTYVIDGGMLRQAGSL
ncbi:MAG: SDR family oxidoreductase [Chloroflexota bacterium]